MARKKRKRLKKIKNQQNRREKQTNKAQTQNIPKAQKLKIKPNGSTAKNQKPQAYGHIKKDLLRSFIFTLLTFALLLIIWYKKII